MTIVQKSIRGTWEAVDEIELGSGRVLKVSTHKVSSGDIITTATVLKREGGFLSHMMFQDFSQRLLVSAVRCTEKNVTAHHATALMQLGTVRQAIDAHYAKETNVA